VDSVLILNLKFGDLVTASRPSQVPFEKQSLTPTKKMSLYVRGRREPRRGNARRRTKDASTRLPPAGPPEAHAEILCSSRSHWLRACDGLWPK